MLLLSLRVGTWRPFQFLAGKQEDTQVDLKYWGKWTKESVEANCSVHQVPEFLDLEEWMQPRLIDGSQNKHVTELTRREGELVFENGLWILVSCMDLRSGRAMNIGYTHPFSVHRICDAIKSASAIHC